MLLIFFAMTFFLSKERRAFYKTRSRALMLLKCHVIVIYQKRVEHTVLTVVFFFLHCCRKRRKIAKSKMFSFHKPKVYRSSTGCCICKAKSSSSRFTDSKKYEEDFMKCFQLEERRTGEICNACVLLVKRWKKLPVGSSRNWRHVSSSSYSYYHNETFTFV